MLRTLAITIPLVITTASPACTSMVQPAAVQAVVPSVVVHQVVPQAVQVQTVQPYAMVSSVAVDALPVQYAAKARTERLRTRKVQKTVTKSRER
jgi:hypothetical protein